MIDRSGPISPQPPPSQGPSGKGGVKKQGMLPIVPDAGGPTTEFLGMQVTQDQKEKIYANMCNMIITQIKQDSARQRKALQQIKRAAEGKDL